MAKICHNFGNKFINKVNIHNEGNEMITFKIYPYLTVKLWIKLITKIIYKLLTVRSIICKQFCRQFVNSQKQNNVFRYRFPQYARAIFFRRSLAERGPSDFFLFIIFYLFLGISFLFFFILKKQSRAQKTHKRG